MSLVGIRGTREGGPDAFKSGSLKRRLPIVTLAELSTSRGRELDSNLVQKVLLKNLNADLKVHIMVGVVGNDTSRPILPAEIPAGAIIMQLQPVALPPDCPPIYLRPVFQDPALAQNENHPLPQDVPFGWEFSTNTDQVEILVTYDWEQSSELELNGKVVVMVDIQYDGQWWDTKAIQFAVGQVQLSDTAPEVIRTTGA